MNFHKLLQIVNESTGISCTEYTSKLKSAYQIIFDLDDSEFISIEKKDSQPPSYCHHFFNVNIEFSYKLNKYKVYHALYHYKIPHKSIKAANKEEWDDFLKNMENFEPQPLTDDLLKNKHVQVKTKISVYKLSNQTDRFGMETRELLATPEIYGSIKDVVETVKSIIDGRDDNNQDEQYVDPVVPGGKLIPA